MGDQLLDLVDQCTLVHVQTGRDLKQVSLRSVGFRVNEGDYHKVGEIDALQVDLECPGSMVDCILQSVRRGSVFD